MDQKDDDFLSFQLYEAAKTIVSVIEPLNKTVETEELNVSMLKELRLKLYIWQLKKISPHH